MKKKPLHTLLMNSILGKYLEILPCIITFLAALGPTHLPTKKQTGLISHQPN
jgi:hypothetical protein